MRQLAYDFRDWRSIEAIGRLGADEGVDIRAVERASTRAVEKENEDEDEPEEPSDPVVDERRWVIQCKREKDWDPRTSSTLSPGPCQTGHHRPSG